MCPAPDKSCPQSQLEKYRTFPGSDFRRLYRAFPLDPNASILPSLRRTPAKMSHARARGGGLLALTGRAAGK